MALNLPLTKEDLERLLNRRVTSLQYDTYSELRDNFTRHKNLFQEVKADGLSRILDEVQQRFDYTDYWDQIDDLAARAISNERSRQVHGEDS